MSDTVSGIRHAQDSLAEMTERLIGEFEGQLPPGAVIRCVARTVQQLRQEGVSTPYLAECAEPVTRLQLAERASSETPRLLVDGALDL